MKTTKYPFRMILFKKFIQNIKGCPLQGFWAYGQDCCYFRSLQFTAPSLVSIQFYISEMFFTVHSLEAVTEHVSADF